MYTHNFSRIKEAVCVYESVFQRVEKKYLLTKTQYEKLFPDILARCVPDTYLESNICSIYYDTPDYLLIRRSLEKPTYKEKLRIRSYTVPNSDTNVFVELKKKYLGTVYKRRINLPYGKAMGFLNAADPASEAESQIEKEIAYCFSLYKGMRPSMFISCHRLSYIGKDDYGLRITFDDNVFFRDTELELDKGIYGESLLPEGSRIMEIKTLKSMPLWLSASLDENAVYPCSFSKYGTAYTILLNRKLNSKGATNNV